MDALSILALGVAQAGGGGGGGTSDYSDLSNKPQINNVTLSGNKSLSDLGIPSYTAGDNITINNNEISVNGLALEKEDSFVQDGVDKVEVSGERVFLSQEVNGHYTKGLSLNPSGAINGDDQTASKLFGLTPSRLWFEDYNLDRTVRLAPNANYNGLTVNGNPIAMQSDIPAQELPTISTGDAGKVLTVNSGETGVEWATGGGGSSISGLVNGAGTNSLVQGTESADSTRVALTTGDSAIAGGYLEPDSASGTHISATGKGSIAYGSFDKGQNSTASGVISATGRGSVALGTCYGNNYTNILASGTASMARGFVDGTYAGIKASGQASTAIGYAHNGGYGNYTIIASGTSSIATGTHLNYNGIVASGANSIARGYNTSATGCSTIAKGENSIAVQQGPSGSNAGASAYGSNSIAIGQGVVADERQVIVLGKYNEYENPLTTETQYNAPAVETNVPVFQDNHSYAVGDVMKQNSTSTNYRKCTQAHTSASNWSVEMSNYSSYWETVNFYTDSKYVLVIGNGTAYNNRSNALTVDWNGNLVCNNIPACPSSDGVYNLQVSIVNGVPTYS